MRSKLREVLLPLAKKGHLSLRGIGSSRHRKANHFSRLRDRQTSGIIYLPKPGWALKMNDRPSVPGRDSEARSHLTA